MKESETTIIAYGGSRIKPLGTIECVVTAKNEISMQQFLIMDTGTMSILGLKACVDLNLIRRLDTVKQSTDTKQFKGLGCFATNINIELIVTAHPSVKPARRIPLKIMDAVKSQLDNMVEREIITMVDGPTDWVSNMVGYWQMKLNEEASKMCTFSTPFGNYRYLRLPFGIKLASELFQKHNARNFAGIDGVIVYFDDILVAAETKEKHDDIMQQVMQRAKEQNIKFNPSKLQYCVNEVKYVGHIMSAEGISFDTERLTAINKIGSPKDKKDVQKLLGMINYMRQYIPKLAELSQPLRELLKKNVVFQW